MLYHAISDSSENSDIPAIPDMSHIVYLSGISEVSGNSDIYLMSEIPRYSLL